MKTLIKLSESHYVIVDDSEIKEWYIHKQIGKYRVCNSKTIPMDAKAITYSTKPLELINSLPDTGQGLVTEFGFNKIKHLNFIEVE